MAAIAQPLTLEEFHTRYAGEKPYYEYWFGEAVQKSVGTWFHSILQGILVGLLRKAGYKAATELELRIDPEWEPVADVAGSLKSITTRYPTEPLDVVVEVLSPEDRMSRVIAKCQNYARIGISQIFVLDPEARLGWQWGHNTLEPITSLTLNNGSVIDLTKVWQTLESEA